MSSAAFKPDLRQIGRDALVEVLGTLLSRPVTLGSSNNPAAVGDARDAITSTVHFQGPQVSGIVRMHLPVAFAAEVARVLIGLDETAPDAQTMMNDTAGELGNMVAGKVVTQLATQGYSSVLGTPSVALGLESFSNGGGADGARLNASCAGHPLSLEIQCHSLLP